MASNGGHFNLRAAVIWSVFFVYACNSPDQQQTGDAGVHAQQQTVQRYPDDLVKVFEAHGGLERWRKMQSLSFEMVKESGNEQHYIQLSDRRDRVEGPNFLLGYDGDKVWVEADTTYKGNPEFYHNLMFYFYAMPFVLADDGINYSETEPLDFDGTLYPGISISYHDGIGTSPKDEYFLYYNPETHEMAWLGYTVTYFSGEESDDVHWIRYAAWSEFNGLKLPTALSWYNYENRLPTDARNTQRFVSIKVSEERFVDDIFKAPG